MQSHLRLLPGANDARRREKLFDLAQSGSVPNLARFACGGEAHIEENAHG